MLLLPGTAIGGLLGELLGLERFGRLSVAVVLVSLMRLLSGVVASAAGWGVTGSVAALTGGTWLAWLIVLWVSPGVSTLQPAPGDRRHELVETLRAAERVGAFLLISNLDVLLARHFLSARDSGIYVLGSLFAKASLWGPQFIAVLAYPRLAAGRERARTLVRAAVWIAAFGGGIALASVVLAGPLVRGMSGAAYAPAARLAPWFALLGTGLALVHLCMIATVAVGERTFGVVIWAAAAVEAIAVSVGPHERPAQVLGVCLVVTAALVGAGVLSLLRHRRARLRPDPLGLAPLP
jgi:hypothetical protein